MYTEHTYTRIHIYLFTTDEQHFDSMTHIYLHTRADISQPTIYVAF